MKCHPRMWFRFITFLLEPRDCCLLPFSTCQYICALLPSYSSRPIQICRDSESLVSFETGKCICHTFQTLTGLRFVLHTSKVWFALPNDAPARTLLSFVCSRGMCICAFSDPSASPLVCLLRGPSSSNKLKHKTLSAQRRRAMQQHLHEIYKEYYVKYVAMNPL